MVAAEEFDAAEQELKEMLAESPGEIELIGSLGIVATKQQKFRSAIAYFEQILALSPNEPNAIYQLVMLYREVGEVDRADEYLKLYQSLEK
jgi:predicted Zn-dependent protease